jgi:anti-sigma regulatory factor (Ser/Thr protein kinase)
MATLILPPKLESLEPITSFVLSGIEQSDLPEETALQIELVLEELLVNVVSYAYPDGEGSVEVGYSIDGDGFCLSIKDWGIPFNPLSAKDPNLSEDISERKVGGLGIFFVKEMASELAYSREDDSNVLRLCFNMQPEIPGSER